jgi:hypothetical protein
MSNWAFFAKLICVRFDYLQYFDQSQTDTDGPSRDWFYVAAGTFHPLDKNIFLDRNQEFGFVNLRGHTLVNNTVRSTERSFGKSCSGALMALASQQANDQEDRQG